MLPKAVDGQLCQGLSIKQWQAPGSSTPHNVAIETVRKVIEASVVEHRGNPALASGET